MHTIKLTLKILIPILAFGFLGSELYKLSDSIDEHRLSLDFDLLLVSILALIILFLADAAGWLLILRSIKQRIPLGRGLFIWFYSAFCRYIPGIVWPYLTRIELSHSEGIDKATASTSMILENILLAGTSLALSAPLVFIFFDLDTQKIVCATLLAAAGFSLLIFISRTSIFIKLNNKYLFSLASLNRKKLLYLTLYYFLFWLAFGFTFLLFSMSVISVEKENLLLIALAFPVSFAIGFIASLSPGGLGIREGVLYALLSMQMDGADAALIAITSRIWLITVELLIALVIAGIFLSKRVLRF